MLLFVVTRRSKRTVAHGGAARGNTSFLQSRVFLRKKSVLDLRHCSHSGLQSATNWVNFKCMHAFQLFVPLSNYISLQNAAQTYSS